jgi:hypothetical protein
VVGETGILRMHNGDFALNGTRNSLRLSPVHAGTTVMSFQPSRDSLTTGINFLTPKPLKTFHASSDASNAQKTRASYSHSVTTSTCRNFS